MNVNLSIIILSYNTKELTKRCFSSLYKNLPKNNNFLSEIIIVDNGSTDGSMDNIKNQISKHKDTNKKSNIFFQFIPNKTNLGYPKGNNQALKIASGKYILFLNSDTVIEKLDFFRLINYLESNQEIGALTVKVLLPNGKIDPASHRGFPTPWSAFCYFVGLEKLFNKIPYLNRIFGNYHLVHLDYESVHEIDSGSGAFYLTRKDLLDRVGGFDETFFMYGEDLDLSFRIKKLGYKIIYYPDYKVIHLKHASGLEKKDRQINKKTQRHFFKAMEIFYKKHYEKTHTTFINSIIYLTIKLIKKIYV